MFDHSVEKFAIDHAMECFPEESVGVIVNNGTEYIRLENKANNKENDFYVQPDVYVELIKKYGKIDAVVHSHPFEGLSVPRLYPSAQDMKGQLSTAVPWGIVCCDKERFWPIQWFGDPCPIPPLEGRIFIHGIQDCYSLIRDYYRLNHDLTIKEFPRDWAWWHEKAQNLYEEGFGIAGFVQVPLSKVRPGDVFLAMLGRAAIKANVVNHGGIYLGNDIIVHHKSGDYAYDPGRLSVKECIQRYMPYIKYFLRHESLM